MHVSSRLVLCGLGIIAVTVIGCAPTQRNSNGDSGTMVTTLSKLANPDQNIGALNSAELQILVSDLPSLVQQMPQLGLELPEGFSLPALNDQEAEALEQFLDDNGISTYEDLGDLASAVESGDVEIPAILMDKWEAFSAQFGRPRPA
jgi:hypothetical protein